MIISSSTPPGEYQVSRLQKILMRRHRTILMVAALGLGLSLASYLGTPPRYAAEAVLALDGRQLQGMPSEAVISPLPQDSPALKTELDIIQSRLMAEKVLDRLTAQGVTLDPYRRSLSLVDRVKAWLREDVPAFLFGRAPAPAVAVSPEQRRQDEVNLLLSHLGVGNDGHSLTIFLSYSADDADTAAKVANAYAATYIDHQVEVQMAAVDKVRTWLGEKVDGLRSDVEASESARTQFRQQQGIVEVDGATLQAHRVASLDAELVSVRASLGGARARLDTARNLVAAGNGVQLAEVLASPTVQNFRIEQARIQRAIDDLDSAGATKSGDLPALKSQLNSIDQQIGVETQHVIDSLANEVAVLESKQDGLTAELASAQADLDKSNIAMVKAAELDREADASRELYDSYLTRYKQTVEQDGIASPEGQIISPAQPSTGRISPSLNFALLAGLVGGTLAGIGAAFLREFTDRRIRSAAQIEEVTGLDVLAAIRSPDRRRQRRRQGTTPFEQSIANLHATLRSGAATSEAKVVTLTSADPHEGKTLTTAALAFSLSTGGCTVLAFDLDPDDDSLEETLRADPTITLDAALRNPGMVMPHARGAGEIAVVTCRPSRLSPEALVDAKRFGALLATVRNRFDFILIDTPALAQRAVALQAAAQSEFTLLVVNTAHTSIRDVADAARQLQGVGHGGLAVVTTDFTKPAKFSFQSEATTPAPLAVTARAPGIATA